MTRLFEELENDLIGRTILKLDSRTDDPNESLYLLLDDGSMLLIYANEFLGSSEVGYKIIKNPNA